MEIKKYINFEIKKEDRNYTMMMPDNAPLAEVYEAVGFFMDKTIALINEHAEKIKPKKVEDLDDKSSNT